MVRAPKRLPPVVMEDVQIRFRNFAGKEGTYNKAGDRNFCLFLDPDTADAMAADGWNIKQLKPRIDALPGDRPQDYVQVNVGYKVRPPNIVMLTSRGRTKLGENEIIILDWADIKMVDLVINPGPWEVNGKSGIKAWVKSLFVTIEEDELDLKYADVPDSAQNVVGLAGGDPDDSY